MKIRPARRIREGRVNHRAGVVSGLQAVVDVRRVLQVSITAPPRRVQARIDAGHEKRLSRIEPLTSGIEPGP